jgi:hypothetical protein
MSPRPSLLESSGSSFSRIPGNSGSKVLGHGLFITGLRYIVIAGQKTLFQSRDAILSSLEVLRRRNTTAYHAVLACPSRSVLEVF